MAVTGRDVRAIVSIDPGIKNFAYAVLVASYADPNSPAASSCSVTLPSPGFRVWEFEKHNLSAPHNADAYTRAAALVLDVCRNLRETFGQGMRIDVLIEMQMQTNTYTFPLVYFLLGHLTCHRTLVQNVFTIAPRTKLAARVVSAVWKACFLQFSQQRDGTAHPFTSNSKATSLTFTDAFIAQHGATHTCRNGASLQDVWRSPVVRASKRDDLADALLQGVALWAAESEVLPTLQKW